MLDRGQPGTFSAVGTAGWILVGLSGGGLGLLVLLKLAQHWSADERAIRALRRRVPTPIKDVRDGSLVLVEGEIHARDSLIEAPLSGRPCVAFRVYALFQKMEDPELVPRKNELAFGSVRFEVDDGSGRIEVDATSARLVLKADFVACEPTYALRKIWKYPRGRAEPLEFCEAILESKQRVRVGGVARLASQLPRTSGAGYRDTGYALCLGASSLPLVIAMPGS